MAKLKGEFDKRGVKVAALSCNDTASHQGWVKDIESVDFCGGMPVDYPIISDPTRDIAVLYGMLDPEEVTQPSPRETKGNEATSGCLPPSPFFFITPTFTQHNSDHRVPPDLLIGAFNLIHSTRFILFCGSRKMPLASP